MDIRCIGGNAVGDFLEEGSFAGFWCGDDHPALAATDRGDEIHEAGREFGAFIL